MRLTSTLTVSPSPFPLCVSHVPNPLANRSGVNRKLASILPSPTGNVSSNSAEFVKFRMQN